MYVLRARVALNPRDRSETWDAADGTGAAPAAQPAQAVGKGELFALPVPAAC